MVVSICSKVTIISIMVLCKKAMKCFSLCVMSKESDSVYFRVPKGSRQDILMLKLTSKSMFIAFSHTRDDYT